MKFPYHLNNINLNSDHKREREKYKIFNIFYTFNIFNTFLIFSITLAYFYINILGFI